MLTCQKNRNQAVNCFFKEKWLRPKRDERKQLLKREQIGDPEDHLWR
jgi:hypothetical protein